MQNVNTCDSTKAVNLHLSDLNPLTQNDAVLYSTPVGNSGNSFLKLEKSITSRISESVEQYLSDDYSSSSEEEFLKSKSSIRPLTNSFIKQTQLPKVKKSPRELNLSVTNLIVREKIYHNKDLREDSVNSPTTSEESNERSVEPSQVTRPPELISDKTECFKVSISSHFRNEKRIKK